MPDVAAEAPVVAEVVVAVDIACNSSDIQFSFQKVFCFAFLESYIFISDEKVKAQSNRRRNYIFSFSWQFQDHIGSFLSCFTYPS